MSNELADRSFGVGQDAGGDARSSAQEELRALINASSDVLYRMNADWSEMRELDGRGILADTPRPLDNWLVKYVDPADQARVLEAIRNAIENRCTFELEHRVRKSDGSLGWTLSRAVPIVDDKGEIIEWLGTAMDLTAHRRTEEELARVIAQSEQQRRFYESLISTTPDLIYAFDRDYRFIFANTALLEMWGRTFEDSIGKRLLEVGYEPWHAEMHEREIDKVIATKAGIRGEVGFPHATLGWRTYDYIFMPVLNADGEVQSIAGTTRDITEIKRAEQHLQLLVNELNHRVKNTLATIQSIARQTFRGDAAEPQARDAFEQRLVALSNAHTVLTRTNWESADLREIAEKALEPFAGDRSTERWTISGEDVSLAPQIALALAMAFHELASNAVKYGALSGPAGSVALDWNTNGGGLSLQWKENGGPRVERPSRRGFGSRLLERGLAGELGGEVRLDFSAEGVVCTMAVPHPGDDRLGRS